ncbi:MAG: sigma-70 family RNA polymerase sigma factor [Planctomycetota bacterium]
MNSSTQLNAEMQYLCDFIQSHREELRMTAMRNMDRRLTRRTDPSDILQDALIESLKAYPAYAETNPMPLFDWLRFVVKNTARNANAFHIATQKRSVHRETRESGIVESRCNPQNSSATHVAMKRELVNRKRECLNMMPPDQSEIIRLRHVQGLSNGEVAELLGISVRAASKRYYRALEKLSSLMRL